jgi:hypothetical protein
MPPPLELRLSSLDDPPDERAIEWGRRIQEVEATQHRAQDVYVGDHWRAASDAYRLAQRYSSRTELWVISAGYGLIACSTLIKSYSATFANGSADSVWRGPADGDRREYLREWWHALSHEAALPDLLRRNQDDVIIICAGAAYVAAFEADLRRVVNDDATCDRVSVLSAGSEGTGPLLPVNAQFRRLVGGTDAALNARLLRLLAAEAPMHRFSHSAMAARLRQMAASLPVVSPPMRVAITDEEVASEIEQLREDVPGVSRTAALRHLRASGIACGQTRFAAVWGRIASAHSAPTVLLETNA